MLSFKEFFNESDHGVHEDPNGELQAGIAASGANTVMDGKPVRQKFMSSEKKTTIKLDKTPIWKIPKGHQPRRNGAGTHGDRRLKRLKTRGNQNNNAIKDFD